MGTVEVLNEDFDKLEGQEGESADSDEEDIIDVDLDAPQGIEDAVVRAITLESHAFSIPTPLRSRVTSSLRTTGTQH